MDESSPSYYLLDKMVLVWCGPFQIYHCSHFMSWLKSFFYFFLCFDIFATLDSSQKNKKRFCYRYISKLSSEMNLKKNQSQYNKCERQRQTSCFYFVKQKCAQLISKYFNYYYWWKMVSSSRLQKIDSLPSFFYFFWRRIQHWPLFLYRKKVSDTQLVNKGRKW